jgi:hypothetical protein
MGGRRATSEPERITRNRRRHQHRSAAAPPTPIAMAIDNIEDPINFISNRPAKTPTHERPVNHARDSNDPPKTIHPQGLITTLNYM